MALSDQVKLRYSISRLAQLTNPDTRQASAIDDTRLTTACNDVESDFRIHAGIDYDETDNDHNNVGPAAVIIKLRQGMPKGGEEARSEYEDVVKQLKNMSKIGARDRILPTVDNDMQLDPPVFGERPRFASSKFRGIRPR